MKRFITAALLLWFGAQMALGGDVTISNNRVSMTFAGEKAWNFKSFIVDGHQLIPEGGINDPVWILTLRGTRGEDAIINPNRTRFEGGDVAIDGKSVVFTWKVLLKREEIYPVRVEVRLEDDESLLPQWRISAQLPEGWKVFDLEFPRIGVGRIPDAKGIMSVGFGAEYPLGNSGMIQSHYPSCTGGMNLIMAHNGSSTLYFSPLDKDACSKYLQILCTSRTLTFVQKLPASYAWTTDEGKFELPWASVIGYNPDSWQNTAVKWYRPFAQSCKWAQKPLKEREIAPWIKNADVWLRPGGVKPEVMDALEKAAAYFGKGVGLHWYYWHNHPFDSFYPEYFPALEPFPEMVAKAQSFGFHVTPYTNGRLWDSATDSYEYLKGYEASCRKPDGTLYTEIYSSKVVNSVTCPASEIWQDVLMDVSSRILGEIGTDGVYLDQVGCAASQPCYAPNHGHALGGGGWWPDAYRKVLTEMRSEIYDSDKAMTTEENAEPYIDLFDMMLCVNGPHTPSVHMVPLFPLIYSDYCIYSGYTYIPWRLNDGSFNFMQARSLIWGSQLGWVDPVVLMRKENGAEKNFLRILGEFRKKQHDLFVGGRFLRECHPGGDNPVIDVPSFEKAPAVMGAEWLSRNGKKAVILVNYTSTDHEVVLENGKKMVVKAYSAVRTK